MAAWLPNQLRITANEGARATLAGAECLACCYGVDVCCAIPFMQSVEEGENRYNLTLFAFYELCWPCLCVARAVGLADNARLRELPRHTGLFHIFPS
jgi:hypothetical protein